MVFTVSYRSANGAVVTEAVEAASRGACFAQMKARGITPMNVKEGGASGRARPPSTPLRAHRDMPDGRVLPWVLLALALVLVGGGVWWWMAGREEVASKDDGPKKPSALAKEVKHTASPRPVAPKADVAQKEVVKQHGGGPPPGTVISVRTNDNDLVITAIVGPNGKTNLHTKAVHEPIFSNPSDQLIAAAMNASMTGQMAPLPLGPESELQFKAALKKPILDNPGDSEEVKRMKQVVRETREQIAELMEKGQSFAEILTEHRNLWNENIKVREGIVAEYRRLLSSGDEIGANHYRNTMNIALGQMGIPPLTENDGHSKRRKKRKVEQQQ